MGKTRFGVPYTHSITKGWYYMINGWGGSIVGAFQSKDDAIRDHNMRIKNPPWEDYIKRHGDPINSIIAYGKPPYFKAGRHFTFDEAYPSIARHMKEENL